MPKATKRERQRQNREIRREAMLAAERRRKRFRSARNIGFLLVPVVIIFVILQLTSGGGNDSTVAAQPITCVNRTPATAIKTQSYTEAPPLSIDVKGTYSTVLHTSCGDIRVKLDPKQAPQTVNSFLFLAKSEYYNSTTFHRIVTNFVDQGGDQKGDGTGGPGYKLPDEPPARGYRVGDVAMANSGPGTSGSQFFLVVSKNGTTILNGQGAPYKYSILGHMDAHGLRVAKKINTFGTTAEAGTPTRKIYLFDVGIIFGNQSTSTTTTPATTTTAK